ncbi:putative oxidoreductase -like protein [Trichinella nelsoni]|uniref:Putative oxidoreductase-like protein n=1 Tax=Trichinella nelsoni TaxID=6336 RepID=A0A0V0RPU9_9BILA|nr:putative oxidoreductase -like protein [Trichinella nelsoni]
MDSPLCETELRGEDVWLALAKYFALDPKLNLLDSVSAVRIGVGQGYICSVMQIKLNWKPISIQYCQHLPQSVIAKVPLSNQIKETFELLGFNDSILEEMEYHSTMQFMHNAECSFYLLSLKEKLNFPAAKCYAAWNTDETRVNVILLEDLKDVAATKGLFPGLGVEELKEVVEKIALLQAWSLNTDVEWQKVVINGEVLYERFFKFVEHSINSLNDYLAKYSDKLASFDLNKANSVLKKQQKDIIEFFTEHRKLIPDVIVHGDLWSNNMMFKLDGEGGKISNKLAAIIDWQIVHGGSFVEDVAHLFLFSVNTEVRRAHQEAVFRHYYDTLMKHLHKPLTDATFEACYDMFRKTLAFKQLSFAGMTDRFVDVISKGDEKLAQEMVDRIFESCVDGLIFLGCEKN